jgi:cellulose synthase/poly-beta-1,6-N-acetylglucosamine synthase-like glycosyltransferase
MDWYYYIALTAILSQLVFFVQMCRNYRYALAKYKKKRSSYRPRTALIVPCKDLDSAFEKNITSFFNQDYENYLLWFVVADKSDPAYDKLCKLKSQLSESSKAQDVQVFVAGQAHSCSQKNHNLLHCYKRIGDDVEILAFADSDICVCSDWLSHIVWPLRQPKNGAASGYRWFIPQKNNPASLALSAVNAKIAQLLGTTRFNQAWGGSMAIRVDVFRQVGLDKIWPKALSDDLSLSLAVKKAGKKVVFVPACLVASYESTNWRKLFEFGRRQFLITRVSAPRTWWFGLCSGLYSVLGLWAGVALAIYAAMIGEKNLPLFAAVPILFFASQLSRAILRQKMISKLLKYDLPQMKAARTADILFFWIWSILLLSFIISSAFGRTICWRGIRYKLLGPTETIVVGD